MCRIIYKVHVVYEIQYVGVYTIFSTILYHRKINVYRCSLRNRATTTPDSGVAVEVNRTVYKRFFLRYVTFFFLYTFPLWEPKFLRLFPIFLGSQQKKLVPKATSIFISFSMIIYYTVNIRKSILNRMNELELK